MTYYSLTPTAADALRAAFSRREHGHPVLVPAPRETPDCSTADRLTNAKARRIEERCNYEVTGFVLTHRALPKKAIVDVSNVRWFPNVPDYLLMMSGQKELPGPGVPPPEAIGDEVLAPAAEAISAPTIAPAAPSSAPVLPSLPARPVLTAPPSARLLESTEEALGELARALGCVHNTMVEHNAGWFVPGKRTAYASAYDAIQGLVASLKNGGTVYEGPIVLTGDVVVGGELLASALRMVAQRTMTSTKRAAAEPVLEPVQGGLF